VSLTLNYLTEVRQAPVMGEARTLRDAAKA
jgi:hypothetical protein